MTDQKKVNKFILGILLFSILIFILICNINEQIGKNRYAYEGFRETHSDGGYIDIYKTNKGSIKKIHVYKNGDLKKEIIPGKKQYISNIYKSGCDGVVKGAIAGSITGGAIGAVAGGIAMGSVSMFMTGIAESGLY